MTRSTLGSLACMMKYSSVVGGELEGLLTLSDGARESDWRKEGCDRTGGGCGEMRR